MKKTIAIFLLAAAWVSASAQNINQSVQVNNDYESAIPETGRIGLEMSVPDSLLRFDYNFDYSVFDSPYKGAYEFTPYTIQISPEASRYDGKLLYLRAGAGYLIHPELQFAYAPQTGTKSAMSVYANGGGYRQKGSHDLGGELGWENRWILENSIATMGVDLKGVFTEDALGSINYLAPGAFARIRSLSSGSYFYYDFGIDYRFGLENFVQSAKAQDHLISVTGTAGPVVKNKYRFLVDFDVRISRTSGLREAKANYIGLTPRLSFVLGPATLNAGVKIDYARDLVFSPVAEATFSVLGDATNLYAGLTGGQNFRSAYDFKMANHRFSAYWMYDIAAADFTGFDRLEREKLNIYGGIRGHIGSKFQYTIKGGYALRGNVPLEILYKSTVMYAFNTLGSVYGDLGLSWKDERVDFTSALNVNKAFLTSQTTGFAPALIKGDLSFTYNWDRRIWAGFTVEGSTRRVACGMTGVQDVPGWVDLGVNAEYKLNSRWGVWCKGGNLLCRKIQRVPGFEEKGPYLTLGIALNL